MDKKLTIYDFSDNPTEITLKNFDNISFILLTIISGDETLLVKYKDGAENRFDAATNRVNDFNDGSYFIYESTLGGNLIDDDKWNNLSNSYLRQDYAYSLLKGGD